MAHEGSTRDLKVKWQVSPIGAATKQGKGNGADLRKELGKYS